MFLMPSRYEPCGLGQLISFKYSTVPIARKTGGLADTISEYNSQTEEGSGFLFDDCVSSHLLDAIKRSVNAYNNKEKWLKLIKKIAGFNFSWNESAKEYEKIYTKVSN